MSASTIKYIIADDHPVFRQGLRMALSSDSRLELMAEVSDGVQLLEKLKFEQPDVILLDLKMPGIDGIEATQQIKSLYPDVKVLILTMNDSEQFIRHLMEIGARGYLIKNADAEEIKLAVRACAETGYYLSDRVNNVLLKSIAKGSKSSPHKAIAVFTARELEVLHLICEGLTATEIGNKIFISNRTVEGIKASLLEKTGNHNTAGLIMYAVKHGIISSP